MNFDDLGEGFRDGGGAGLKALVVDDEESVRDVAANILQEEGYEVVMASRSEIEHLAGLADPNRPGRPQFVMDDADDYIVHFIDINNQSVLNDEIIRSRLGVQEGESLDFDELEDSINNIYSIDVFQTVTYALLTNPEGETGLQVNAIPRQWGPNCCRWARWAVSVASCQSRMWITRTSASGCE